MKGAKKTGRKAELRRLAAKRGWYDGYYGSEPSPPTKSVMLPFANGFGEKAVPWDEEEAYLIAYDEGKEAGPDDANPYASDNGGGG